MIKEGTEQAIQEKGGEAKVKVAKKEVTGASQKKEEASPGVHQEVATEIGEKEKREVEVTQGVEVEVNQARTNASDVAAQTIRQLLVPYTRRGQMVNAKSVVGSIKHPVAEERKKEEETYRATVPQGMKNM